MTCAACGFALYHPIADLSVSAVGLYDDARFPGRVIVSLNEHVEHFDNVERVAEYMTDIQQACRALRQLDEVERINVSVLGNKVAHVHAHLIPRRPSDANHGLSPWENAPPLSPLNPAARESLIADIRTQLFRP